MAEETREHFKSRLGFIFVAAGCAIGLGNVWRFPYITGQYGGAAFIVLYLVFLVALGLPVMVMEFAVGRASQKSTARSFDVLPSKKNFRWFGWWGYVGSMLLLMFYTTICGWMLSYIPKMASGMFDGATADTTATAFGAMVGNPSELMAWMLVSVAVGVIVCVLSIPCVLGLNVWSGIAIPGIGDISSIEDFIVSNNILPLGGIIFAVFCCSKWGWGWDSFLAEADAGEGVKFPAKLRLWCTYGIPILGVIIFIMGYVPLISSWLGLGA